MLFPLSHIRPTQMEIGLGYVASRLSQITKRDANLRKAIQSRILPAAIGPNGLAYITDGHHWALASQILARAQGLDSCEVSIEVMGDFIQQTQLDCIRFLYANNEGYFTKSLRSAIAWKDPRNRIPLTDETLLALYRNVPEKLEEMKDNPLRSLTGYAFDQLGIFPEDLLTDYVEFYLIEKMEQEFSESGIPLDRVLGIHEPENEWITTTKNLFVGRPDLVDYLTSFAKPHLDANAVTKSIWDCVSRYRTQTLGLSPT